MNKISGQQIPHKVPFKIWFLIPLFFMLAITIELSSTLCLYFAKKIRSIEYLPIDKKQLSDIHRQDLLDLLHGKASYIRVDSVLGWDISPSAKFGLYTSNSQGIRGLVTYTKEIPTSKKRILLFGDSYTHGDEVDDTSTWAHVLESSLTSTEVVNLGVPGYGPDQALLKYEQKIKTLDCNLVVLGFMPENIHRIASMYRPFYNPHTHLPLFKPRLVTKNDSLTLVPNPFPTLFSYQKLIDSGFASIQNTISNDYHYHYRYGHHPLEIFATYRALTIVGHALFKNHYIKPTGEYNPNHQVYTDLVNIFKTFSRTVKDHGQQPLIIILPSYYDDHRNRMHLSPRHQPLFKDLAKENIPYIDLGILFDSLKSTCTLQELHHGHYTAKANRIVGEYLSKKLKASL